MRLGVWILIAAAVVGCDDRMKESATAPARVINGSGVIRGRVVLSGKPPVMQTIANQPCHDGAGPIAEETVLVGPGGGLKNVFVYIEGVGPGLPDTRSVAVLDQVDCRYVPHCIGLVAGQTLTVKSSDATMHNVHMQSSKNESRNFGMTVAGQTKELKLASPEIFPVKCDVHPWMIAYVGVFENSLFDVTRGDGSFEVKGIPSGRFKLVVWHERYGRLEEMIEVNESAPVTREIAYKAPG